MCTHILCQLSRLSAYFGMREDKGDPQPGQVVMVSGAAGVVGSVAGQIAKIKVSVIQTSEPSGTLSISPREVSPRWPRGSRWVRVRRYRPVSNSVYIN